MHALDLLSVLFLGAVAACLVFFALIAALGFLLAAASRSVAMPALPPARPLDRRAEPFSDEELLAAVRYEQAKAGARDLARPLQGGATQFEAANTAWKAPCRPCEALRRAARAVKAKIGLR